MCSQTLTIFQGKRVLSPLVPRFQLTCGDNGGGPADVDDALACMGYLQNLGQTACEAPGEHIVFCMCGSAVIYGSNIKGGTTSSYW